MHFALRMHFALSIHALCIKSALKRTRWTNQLDRSARWISFTDQLDRSARRITSLFLKLWPVRMFEDGPISLYNVAASESDDGLV